MKDEESVVCFEKRSINYLQNVNTKLIEIIFFFFSLQFKHFSKEQSLLYNPSSMYDFPAQCMWWI